MKISRDYIFLPFLFPFMLFSFLGSHRQKIFDIYLDNVFLLVAFSASVVYIFFKRKLSKESKSILIFFLIFLIINIFSIILNLGDWKNYYLIAIHIVYISTSVCLFEIFKNKKDYFEKIIIRMTLFASMLLITSFIINGGSSWGRITMPFYANGEISYFAESYSDFTDPNLLAFFLGFGLITTFFSQNLRFKKISLLIIASAIILTFSRSAILAIFIVSIYNIFSNTHSIVKNLFISSLILTIFTFIYFYPSNENIREAINSRINSEQSNSDRLDRLQESIQLIKENPIILFTGKSMGFVSTPPMKDPHNFYLSTIIDSGLISLLLILFLLFNLKKTKLSKSLILFFLIISLFYWQLRTFYFLIALLLIIKESNENKFIDPVFSKDVKPVLTQ